METQTFHPDNNDGWRLYLERRVDPRHYDPELRPLAIVPGYGMNSYIFGYHPRGVSMIEYLCRAGFEVWTMNFRSQDHTKSLGGKRKYGFASIVRHDLPTAIACIMAHQKTRRNKLDIIGCSLGGSYLYAYMVLYPDNPLGNVVAMGAPLRWDEVHPVFGIAFMSPRLLELLDMRGTRKLARHVLPLAAKIPGFLHIYLHPAIVDLSRPQDLVKTVEDPNPRLNREIAEWVKRKDLVIDGVNISKGMAAVKNPLYLMLACADGIVPEGTALSARRLAGSAIIDVVTAGDASTPMAHADMFISDAAEERVFKPMTNWLLDHQDPPPVQEKANEPKSKTARKAPAKRAVPKAAKKTPAKSAAKSAAKPAPKAPPPKASAKPRRKAAKAIAKS